MKEYQFIIESDHVECKCEAKNKREATKTFKIMLKRATDFGFTNEYIYKNLREV